MQDARELLTALIARGCEVKADGDRLLVRPRSALDDGLRATIRAHKAELLALILAGPALDPEVAWRVEAMRAQLPRAARSRS